MTDLKPCPFCGAKAELEELGDHHGEYFNLGCSSKFDPRPGAENCPGTGVFYTSPAEDKDAAVAAWNKRTP